jgi:hypothetical protein
MNPHYTPKSAVGAVLMAAYKAAQSSDSPPIPEWQALSKAYEDASARVDAQLLKLQKALKDDPDEQLRAVGEYGLNGVTGNFKVPLQAALIELKSATGEGRRKAIARAYKAVADFRGHIESDEGVAVCDDNPYDIPVGIQSTLGAALARMEPALAAALK